MAFEINIKRRSMCALYWHVKLSILIEQIVAFR
jgi:hypothetical protein